MKQFALIILSFTWLTSKDKTENTFTKILNIEKKIV